MPHTSPAQSIASELRVAIFRQRRSQQEVAQVAGMSTSAIQRRLKGETPITIDELARIASALGLEVQIDLVAPAIVESAVLS